MKKMVAIVSGRNGQLGRELESVASSGLNCECIFLDKEELNIADDSSLEHIFRKYSPSFFINCAAYTAVDKAETEQEIAYKINAEAVGKVAKFCAQFKATLLHISTDYVFDGKAKEPYREEDATNPVNYYGYTKWLGEQLALNNNQDTIIIRVSWLYSAWGNNFVKTMLRLMNEKKEIRVVNDQFGSPTYAKDLAEVILSIVNGQCLPAGEAGSILNENMKHQTPNPSRQTKKGVYHFSNEGIISWYDFAVAIKEIKQLDCIIHPIPTSSYPTPAKRPAYSGLDKTKIANAFNIGLRNWKYSLRECLKLL
jgi:dTDP-4-dehydrorhamnose reductase